ncbi:MAG: cysteine desulfurase, partial [Cytophagales bacterium]|nr:cysteine desulfurase [Cytophagales bacterium]
MAGSGISPSAPPTGNAVNIQEPQTSLPDPNYAGAGKVPHSLAGNGVSPGIASPSHQLKTNSGGVDPELFNVLASIPTFNTIPQIPQLNSSIPSEASYYFLPTSTPHVGKEPKSLGIEHVLANKKHQQAGLIAPPFDGNIFKKDFPILQERVNGKPLIWLDNAATTQKPKVVIDRISYFYEHENSNIHRAAHELAARATDAYESARKKVQSFLNAASPNEIIFVRGATEGINLVAKSWGEQFLKSGDEIILSHLEHHANIVPWQQLAVKKGIKIRVIPVDESGQLIISEYAKLLNPKTKLVSVTQVSNALGTVTPVREIAAMAHATGAKVLVDGAQSVSHMRLDVQEIGADWFIFSGHKVFGPTGIGVVYGKEALLNETEPWQGGGNMIVDVTFEHTKFHKAPGRFEAGTGNIADAVGLGAALDYVTNIGMDLINQYEHYLLVYATKLLEQIPGLRLIGTAHDKASVLSFVFDGFKTEEVGSALNDEGIAVRSGHHCAQPILRRFGLEATVRPSLAFYNTCAD